jgi:hypothetical protein
MHDAQHRVAVLHLVHQHAQGAHVVDLREIQALGAHLVVDAVDVLGPAIHLGLDPDGGTSLFRRATASTMNCSRSTRRSSSMRAMRL